MATIPNYQIQRVIGSGCFGMWIFTLGYVF